MKHTLYTIGHSNRTLEEFIHLLKTHGIKQIIDVRTIPRSRHNPQFNKSDLAKALRNKGIGYRHMKNLGGLRHAKPDSPNKGWRNSSFRGFADYMQSSEFHDGMQKLMLIAEKKRASIMCAEALPWRCHRSLIADAFTVNNWEVREIMSLKTAREHKLTPFLRVIGDRLFYP